jgi:integrase/recombinase XerD
MNTDKKILELINEFITDFERADGTRNLYYKTLQYWVIWSTKNDVHFQNITKSDLIRYKKSLISSGKSNSTIDNYFSAIRKFFTWMFEIGYVDTNVTDTIEWIRDRKGTFIRQALTTDQISKLLNSHNTITEIGSRNYAITDLMAFTGLRCAEVTRLNVGDIRRAANRWHLQIQRKGNREKSGMISVPSDRIKPIQEYWSFRSGPLQEDQLAFVNHSPRSNGTRMTPSSLSRIIKSSLIGIGLNSYKYSAHSLRHTAATIAYYAGAEPWEIGKMLGHRNPRQTEHYIHALGIESADQGKATSKINDYAKKHIKPGKKQANSDPDNF